MKPAAAGLNRQGDIELREKASSVCERWDGHLERALIKKKLFNDVERLNTKHYK